MPPCFIARTTSAPLRDRDPVVPAAPGDNMQTITGVVIQRAVEDRRAAQYADRNSVAGQPL